MGYCRYSVGTTHWKERAARLHIWGLCINCGKSVTPTVFDLYCDGCKAKRKQSKIRTLKDTNNGQN